MPGAAVEPDRAILADQPLLRLLQGEARRLVVDSFVHESFGFGAPIVEEGAPADAWYVLARGRARVVKRGVDGTEIALGVLRAGEGFGHQALFEEGVRTATVRASGAVEVFRLDRGVFRAMARRHPEIQRHVEIQVRNRALENFFHTHPAFRDLPAEAFRTLLDELQPVLVGAGECVVRQGEPPGPMFIVEEGRLKVYTANAAGEREYLAWLRVGDWFGELSVFEDHPRAAHVEAVSDCRLLALRPETFRRLVGDHPAFAEAIRTRIAQYNYRDSARVPLDFARELLPAQAVETEVVSPAQATELDEGAPFADGHGHFVKKGRIRRFPVVRQVDEMDCGAACLAMICRHFGRAVSISRIRQLAHTANSGTSLAGLCDAATELGLAARAIKASRRNLQAMPLPAIAHYDGNHWVVVFDVDARSVRIADPGSGLRRITRQEFDERWTGYAALFDYTDAFEQAPTGSAAREWVAPLLQPYRGVLLQALGLALVVAMVEMVLPVFTQLVVDRVLVEADAGLLHLLVLAMVAMLVFLLVSMVLQRYLLAWVAVRVDAAAFDYVTRRMLALPLGWFQARRTGDIQRRLVGLRHVREFVVQYGVGALTALAQLGAALLLMVLYSPRLALVFLVTVPLYASLMRYSQVKLRPIFDEVEEGIGRYHSRQIDAVKGIETVKAMGAERVLREVMLDSFLGVAQRQFRADFTVLTYEGAVRGVAFLAMVLFLLAGAHEVMAGRLSIGGFVAFNSLVAMANAPITTVLGVWDNLQMVQVLLDRLDDVFSSEPEQGHDRDGLLPVRSIEGRVTAHNLSVRFGGARAPRVLDGVSFDVPTGTTVAIVGRSGSGKTTLLRALAGLVPIEEGAVLYDGVELSTVNHRELRRRVGFVLQDCFLFDDTIARNISAGDDEPDMDRVLWAARVAAADGFVERLPLGYETRVGESGLSLSGGQRQRIAIARAVYHDPAVLFFDEATSALDAESERAVKENLGRLLSGRTAFVIAHRLSTVRDADIIFVLDQGRLVERGTHDELIRRQGLYFYLVSAQLEMA